MLQGRGSNPFGWTVGDTRGPVCQQTGVGTDGDMDGHARGAVDVAFGDLRRRDRLTQDWGTTWHEAARSDSLTRGWLFTLNSLFVHTRGVQRQGRSSGANTTEFYLLSRRSVGLANPH